MSDARVNAAANAQYIETNASVIRVMSDGFDPGAVSLVVALRLPDSVRWQPVSTVNFGIFVRDCLLVMSGSLGNRRWETPRVVAAKCCGLTLTRMRALVNEDVRTVGRTGSRGLQGACLEVGYGSGLPMCPRKPARPTVRVTASLTGVALKSVPQPVRLCASPPCCGQENGRVETVCLAKRLSRKRSWHARKVSEGAPGLAGIWGGQPGTPDKEADGGSGSGIFQVLSCLM